MRIWHYKVIPALPTTQLVAQWRELNSIYEKQDKHILINYIYEYDKIALYNYSLKVIREFKRRGFKIKSFEKFYEYFKDIIPRHQEPLMILFKNEKPPNFYIFKDNRIYRLLFEMYDMAKKLISVLP